MRKQFGIAALAMSSWVGIAGAQSIELEAITDFTALDSGEVPYYRDTGGNRNVLAVDAAIEAYRYKFARAEYVYQGNDGSFDLTINALGELDGEGIYRLSINDVLVGEVTNPTVDIDYTPVSHTFEGIDLIAQDVISVESMATSNDTVPEGNGYAFARGRWRSLTIDINDPFAIEPADVADIAITLSSDSTELEQGGQASVVATVLNQSTDTVVTNPVVVIVLPEQVEFLSSDICVAAEFGARCQGAELLPDSGVDFTITVQAITVGDTDISAMVNADQLDESSSDNASAVSLSIAEPDSTTANPLVDSVTEPGGNDSGELASMESANTGADGDENPAGVNATTQETGTGSVSLYVVLLSLLGLHLRGFGRQVAFRL